VKIIQRTLTDVVSIDRIIDIREEEDEDTFGSGELDEATYAMDSLGRVWRLVESATGMIQAFTDHDGVKRRRGKRLSA